MATRHNSCFLHCRFEIRQRRTRMNRDSSGKLLHLHEADPGKVLFEKQPVS
jgi:hypothetical protein